MKLWGGRFTKPTNRLVEEVNASISFDQELAEEDIQGSIAHVTMLGSCGIITPDEAGKITAGLENILAKIRAGEIRFSVEHEDIHMNIEKLLLDEIGPLGGKLHTGRSRNDQVAVDMHLYVRKQTVELVRLLVQLQQVIIEQAEQHMDTILPGYTHLQRAQPVRLAHHLLAYASMFERDIERLIDSYKRVNTCPLGAGALAGTTFPVDRDMVAKHLGFDRIYDNSMDAVSDRDYLVEFLSVCSLIMVHLSRLSEELILWSSEEFNYIVLDDAFCTGSSMMPQKKNPDIPELIRGKTGRVFGHLTALLTTLKALPLTYNKDLQEDKEGVFDTVKTLSSALSLMAPILQTMKVNRVQMRKNAESGFASATDLADYLVNKGMPFREAHEVVGKLVLYCIEQEKQFSDCSLDELKSFSALIEQDLYQKINCEQVVEARKSFGGTAKTQVMQTLKQKKKNINETLTWLSIVY
ncbi:argininosuccinate lyase [Paenactinomyces guangxiensis]|uniref:Argininosuccinate lyase n=1 Tax=Paenactinomyces guangxiensis TaxID=1490290 RepID=A0A7W1WSN4_9BACL|nr:argininosuccinate lyase [Paenactinomyces guangxiensis]MBA4495338.1 argininosuccinate lyase [Paenactinomyces guangxiensis]MBH8592541.1 argininosuccinate lyase [Paenactinomyces guangxiensis]